MNIKKIISSLLILLVLVSISYVVIKETQSKVRTKAQPQQTNKAAAENTASPSPQSRKSLVVYYFHGNMRCWTCMAFETYTKETLDKFFADKMNSHQITYKVVNVEDSVNEHFITDYSLTTKSIILAEFDNAKEVKWKNLDKIWQLVRNKEQFIDYLKIEINSFLM